MLKNAKTIGALFMGTCAGIFLVKPEPAVAGMYAISCLTWAFTLWIESDRDEALNDVRLELSQLQQKVNALTFTKGMMR